VGGAQKSVEAMQEDGPGRGDGGRRRGVAAAMAGVGRARLKGEAGS
jgi:hypothetical protein